jgi:hypothetical protein
VLKTLLNKIFEETFMKRIGSLAFSLFVGLSISACDGGGSDGLSTSDEFDFDTSPASAFTQIDRHGAVEAGTVGIGGRFGFDAPPIRSQYNLANPQVDATGVFVPDITESVTFFLGALGDDLTALGLVPASVQTSLAQAGPVLVPDTIKLDPTQPVSYPNGRNFEDAEVDRTLAAALLDLSAPGQSLTMLDGVLNPVNDGSKLTDDFPFMGPPNLPTP